MIMRNFRKKIKNKKVRSLEICEPYFYYYSCCFFLISNDEKNEEEKFKKMC